MCHLCDELDEFFGSDHCVCIRCGAAVCFDASDDDELVPPSITYEVDLICQACFDAQ